MVLSVVLSADSTLPNGIRISDIPSSGNTRFEMVVGYQSGVRNENEGMSGLASIVSRFLASSDAARALSLAAYGAGGEMQFINELDRTAIRVNVPDWAKPMVLAHVAALLGETPENSSDLLDRARRADRPSTFRSRVEDEIRIGLLSSHPYHHPMDGWAADVQQITNEHVVRFFNENYGTDRAFVLTASPVMDEFRQKLSAIPERKSRKISESAIRAGNAERILRFPSEENAGAMIFASPLPGVFYRGWYAVLMLDGLIRRAVPGKPVTSIIPTLDPYYWRLEVPVPPGQFAETVQDNVLQEINRLQFARAKADDLETARRDATEYINSRYVQEWFASQGIEPRRQEGLAWIASFTADDMRSTARDLLIMNRVIASWSPKPKQNGVQVENISDTSGSGGFAGMALKPLSPVTVAPFPNHNHPAPDFTTPERLNSGVWVAASTEPMIFLAGSEKVGLPEGNRRDGPNGSVWTQIGPADENVVRAFQKYRAERILVLYPAALRDKTRSVWNAFKSTRANSFVPDPVGKVANIDLPALIILKAMLDRKLIESGWWHDASLRIDAAQGAALQIDASPEIRNQVLEWIKAVGDGPMNETDFNWAREVAIHHLNDVLPDVQMLLWQRVPGYVLTDLSTIQPTQVQDVAKLYF